MVCFFYPPDWVPPSNGPGVSRARQVGWVVSGLLLVGCLSGPAWLPAAEPDSSALTRDLLHTVQARRALLEDDQLAPLNLGVKVSKRVAVLWGPVPSPAMADRAIRRLKEVVELIEVKNQTTLLPPEPGGMGSGAPRPRFLPDPVPPAPPDPPKPVVNPVNHRPVLLSQPPVAEPKRPPGKPRVAPAAVQRENEVVMPSLRVPLPPLDDPLPNPPPPQTLTDHVRELQRVHLRYQGIRIEVRDRLVYLQSNSAPPESIRDMARAVARISGVDGVIVGSPAH